MTFGVNSDHKVNRIGCSAPLMKFETDFLGALERVNSYRTSSSLLQLYTSDGQRLSFYANTDLDRPIKVKNIEVAPQMASCSTMAQTESMAQAQCLQIREGKNQPWVSWFGNIDGFEFVPGTAYTLRIAEEILPHVATDGNSLKRILLQTLEAKRVQNLTPLGGTR